MIDTTDKLDDELEVRYVLEKYGTLVVDVLPEVTVELDETGVPEWLSVGDEYGVVEKLGVVRECEVVLV